MMKVLLPWLLLLGNLIQAHGVCYYPKYYRAHKFPLTLSPNHYYCYVIDTKNENDTLTIEIENQLAGSGCGPSTTIVDAITDEHIDHVNCSPNVTIVQSTSQRVKLWIGYNGISDQISIRFCTTDNNEIGCSTDTYVHETVYFSAKSIRFKGPVDAGYSVPSGGSYRWKIMAPTGYLIWLTNSFQGSSSCTSNDYGIFIYDGLLSTNSTSPWFTLRSLDKMLHVSSSNVVYITYAVRACAYDFTIDMAAVQEDVNQPQCYDNYWTLSLVTPSIQQQTFEMSIQSRRKHMLIVKNHPSDTVVIEILSSNLTFTDDCLRNNLQIYKGPCSVHSQTFTKFCGTGNPVYRVRDYKSPFIFINFKDTQRARVTFSIRSCDTGGQSDVCLCTNCSSECTHTENLLGDLSSQQVSYQGSPANQCSRSARHKEWNIHSIPGDQIKVSILNLFIDYNTQCSADKLLIYDGNTDRLLTGMDACTPVDPTNIRTYVTSNFTRIVYKEYPSYTKRGFNITYKIRRRSYMNSCTVDIPVSHEITAERYYAHRTDIMSLGYPDHYPNNFTEDWLIFSDYHNDYIIIEFVYVSMESCLYDSLKIYAGQCLGTTPVRTVCDSDSTAVVIRGDSARLHFSTDRSVTFPGFRIQVYTSPTVPSWITTTTVPPTTLPTLLCDSSVISHDVTQAVTSLRIGPYSTGCYTFRTTQPGQHIEVTLTTLFMTNTYSCETNKLVIYEGAYDYSSHRILYTCSNSREGLTYSVPMQDMAITFHSSGANWIDISYRSTSVDITYCSQNVPVTNRFQATTVPQYIIQSSISSRTTTQWFITKTNIYDVLVIEVIEAQMGGRGQDCYRGKVEVHSGPCESSTMVGTFCSFTPTYTIDDHQIVMIKYTSITSSVYSAFRLKFYTKSQEYNFTPRTRLPAYSIILIVIGVFVVGIAILFFVCRNRRNARNQRQNRPPFRLPPPPSQSSHQIPTVASTLPLHELDVPFPSEAPPSYDDVLKDTAAYQISVSALPNIAGAQVIAPPEYTADNNTDTSEIENRNTSYEIAGQTVNVEGNSEQRNGASPLPDDA